MPVSLQPQADALRCSHVTSTLARAWAGKYAAEREPRLLAPAYQQFGLLWAIAEEKLAGVFGMFMRDVRTGTSGNAFLSFGFAAPSKRYPRLTAAIGSSSAQAGLRVMS
jgi:hypothetical protein